MPKTQRLRVRSASLSAKGCCLPRPTPDKTLPANVIKAMCMHLAHDCNLRCGYCFAKGGAFAGKRELMDEDTARTAVDYLIAASGPRRNLEVDFFGGEPLLNFAVLKKNRGVCAQH